MLEQRTGINSLHLCKANPAHIVGDAGFAMISAWLVPRLSPCMGQAWGGRDQGECEEGY